MSLVTIVNKTPQKITIGLTNDSNPSVVDGVSLGPRKSIKNVDSGRVTSYTDGLAKRGHLSIIPESA